MDDNEWLAHRFEENRSHLRAVAYNMLGSLSEADDAVQDTWLRVTRADTREIANLRAWLTTIVARVSLNMLRARRTHREELLGEHVPLSTIAADDAADPEAEVVLADSVGLALLVVLETLTPAERLAFVLHDMFDMPFDEIAPIVGRTPDAARQLASRGRRRVQGQSDAPETDTERQREVVEAFLAASRNRDFDALIAVLDPDVMLRADGAASPTGAFREVRSAARVARGALAAAARADTAQPALVNGAVGIVNAPHGEVLQVLLFTIAGGRIRAIDIVGDPERVSRLDLASLP